MRVGGGAEIDACGAVGRVAGLRAGGDGFLAVRKGPGKNFDLVDKIFNGQVVFMCDSAKNGAWLGIVYSTSEESDCDVTSPLADARAYMDVCKSGWVRASWVKLIAG
ncbi:hypothetical protein [Lysobacter koreensis]|uniref:hypothetical protein n=1 Tax=Lysobacter koreensis TaxID=266122 RepID=UPI0036DA76E8